MAQELIRTEYTTGTGLTYYVERDFENKCTRVIIQVTSSGVVLPTELGMFMDELLGYEDAEIDHLHRNACSFDRYIMAELIESNKEVM